MSDRPPRTLSNLIQEINTEAESGPLKVKNSIHNHDSSEKKFDDIIDFKNHQSTVLKALGDEIKFKKHARIWSLVILCGLSLIMFINIFVMIYGQGRSFWGWFSIPEIRFEIILAMITATFVNLLAIVNLVFKYIFSPTKELMNHTNELNGNKN